MHFPPEIKPPPPGTGVSLLRSRAPLLLALGRSPLICTAAAHRLVMLSAGKPVSESAAKQMLTSSIIFQRHHYIFFLRSNELKQSNLPSLQEVHSASTSPSTRVSLWSNDPHVIIPQIKSKKVPLCELIIFRRTSRQVLVSCTSHKLVLVLRSEWGRCFLAEGWCPSPKHWSEAAGSQHHHPGSLLSGSGQNTQPNYKAASCSRHYTQTHWRQRKKVMQWNITVFLQIKLPQHTKVTLNVLSYIHSVSVNSFVLLIQLHQH